jgi:hypothetical protein
MSSPVQIEIDSAICAYVDAFLNLPLNHSLAKEICSKNSYPESIDTLTRILEMGLKYEVEKSIKKNMPILEAKSTKFIHKYLDSMYTKEIMVLANSSPSVVIENKTPENNDIISPSCLLEIKKL